MAVADTSTVVTRIWARDASLWTNSGEERWLGWLDEPARMQSVFPAAIERAERVRADGFTDVVLLGMGGSSLAPEVMRCLSGSDSFHVLDTTHPAAIMALEDRLDVARTLFVVASKSGSTLETRSQLDYFWHRTDERAEAFVAITDPGSNLERLARARGFRSLVAGVPAIGGRYSALSPFGIEAAALMEIDAGALLARAVEAAEACRQATDNPGLELGLALGGGWREGRDKVVINPNPGGFGLWVEQLLAESTGKQGCGLVPVPDASAHGPDRQEVRVEIAEIADLGYEFFRFEFATAVAGGILGINPFDQPDVQAAKDRTTAILAGGGQPQLEPEGSIDELLAEAEIGDYVAILAFVAPEAAAAERLAALREGIAARTGLPTTVGYGPRYLHSTGQLHKGGPRCGLFVQIVDDPPHLPIPGREFGFRRLIHAQALSDFEALRESGQRVVRLRWEELSP
ncbi:MAG: glucose-6-phosphate isomerase [Actinomycetia bacterium]|nr:glucose-6-phosphate isomerase [Actinomycetes bacterium]